MNTEPQKSEFTIESAEFCFEGMSDERFKYWYGRHEHQLMSRCKQFIKSNPTYTNCLKVDFVIDKENSKGKFVATITKPGLEEVTQAPAGLIQNETGDPTR